MSKQIVKPLRQRTKNISVITLMAFLLAIFLHSQHISKPHSEQNSIAEYQDCHICQQGIDSPPKFSRLTVIIRENFSLIITKFITIIDSKHAYASPQLRAPPFFL